MHVLTVAASMVPLAIFRLDEPVVKL